jgi:transcriptional regulator NrdR family protein
VWGFGIYLMRLSDYLAGRKHKKRARTCDVCGQRFRMIEEMEVHRRKEHPEAHPRKEESPEV